MRITYLREDAIDQEVGRSNPPTLYRMPAHKARLHIDGGFDVKERYPSHASSGLSPLRYAKHPGARGDPTRPVVLKM